MNAPPRILRKYCKPQHNIRDGCRTIRLGTLNYYKNLDPSFAIADPTEGAEELDVVSIDTATRTRESMKALEGVISVPEGVPMKIENNQVRFVHPNVYVWCCSGFDDDPTQDIGERFSHEYTSSFDIGDASDFARYIESLLWTHATVSIFEDRTRQRLMNVGLNRVKKLSIAWAHRRVEYVSSKNAEIVDGVLRTEWPDIPRHVRQVFTKEEKFRADREYRFVFGFSVPGVGTLQVKEEPLDLPIFPVQIQ